MGLYVKFRKHAFCVLVVFLAFVTAGYSQNNSAHQNDHYYTLLFTALEKYRDGDSTVLPIINAGIEKSNANIDNDKTNSLLQINALLFLSEIYSLNQWQNNELGFKYIKQADSLAVIHAGNPIINNLQAEILAQKAIQLFYHQQVEAAINTYLLALKQLEKYPSDLIYRRVYTGLGYIHLHTNKTKNFLLAVEYYNSATRFAERMNRSLLAKELKLRIIQIYLKLHENDPQHQYLQSADSMLAKVEQYSQKYQLPNDASYFIYLAEIALAHNRPTEVIRNIDSAENKSTLTGFNYRGKNVYLHLLKAQALVSIEKYQEATTISNQIEESSMPQLSWKAAYYMVKHQILQHNKNYDSAILYLKKFYAAKDTIAQELQTERLEDINKKYETARKDATITAMKTEKTNTRLWSFIIAITTLFIIGVLLFFYNKSKNRLKRTLTDINTITSLHEFQLMEATENAKHQERKNIGMELHDNLAGTISAATHIINNHVMSSDNIEENARWQHLIQLLNKAYENLRNKSHQMYQTETNNQVFIDILQQNIHLFFFKSNIKITITVEPLVTQLSPEVKHCILTTVKEAAINIFKHSNATEVTFLLYEENNHFHLLVSDNGKGFKNSSLNKKSGIGLQTLSSRLKELGGVLKIKPSALGSEIEAILPLS